MAPRRSSKRDALTPEQKARFASREITKEDEAALGAFIATTPKVIGRKRRRKKKASDSEE